MPRNPWERWDDKHSEECTSIAGGNPCYCSDDPPEGIYAYILKLEQEKGQLNAEIKRLKRKSD